MSFLSSNHLAGTDLANTHLNSSRKVEARASAVAEAHRDVFLAYGEQPRSDAAFWNDGI